MNQHGENGTEATRGTCSGNSPDSPLPIKLKAWVADLRALADEMEAYGSIQKTLSDHQAIVCAYVDVNGPCSDREIAEGLHWPINDVTGRRNEDVKLGLLVFAGTKLDQVTNRTVMTWKAI